MSDKFIKYIEDEYGVRYVGYYDIPTPKGPLGPFLIFYQENPNITLGHSHYMGVGFGLSGSYVFNAKSIEDASYNAIYINDKYICSRYRHDYQTEGSSMIDGGLDYTRCSGPITHQMKIVDGKEVFIPIGEKQDA
jgi:hypothetical protein